jgi:hypothetical protein
VAQPPTSNELLIIFWDSNLSPSTLTIWSTGIFPNLYDSSGAHGNDDPAARLPFGTVRWKKLGLLQQQRASSEILSRLNRFACPMNKKYGGYGMLWQQ